MKRRKPQCLSLTSCAVLAFAAGCGGSQPPIGAPGEIPQTRVNALHSDQTRSWMLPEALQDDLLYAANANANTVTGYSYSNGDRTPPTIRAGVDGPSAIAIP